MGKTKYWVGSLDLAWDPGLARYLEWGDEVDADLVDAKDGRWSSTAPASAADPDKKEAKHADDSAKEDKKGGDDA